MATTTEPRVATVSVTVGDQELTFESGKMAKQADGAVVVRSGETMVLAAATGRMEAREGADFFPLTVDVEERMYAAGKIPGSFFRREGRPSDQAVLTCRLIDRPLRPSFAAISTCTGWPSAKTSSLPMAHPSILPSGCTHRRTKCL